MASESLSGGAEYLSTLSELLAPVDGASFLRAGAKGFLFAAEWVHLACSIDAWSSLREEGC